MSKLAGIFYFDYRPIPPDDDERISRAIRSVDGYPIRLHRQPGLLFGYGPDGCEPAANGWAGSTDGWQCAWDGRLDSGIRLREEYGSPPEEGDAALALQAYRRHGCRGLVDVIGDWSLALWDPQARGVILASDYAGIRPLYYYRGSDRLLWSSSLSDLVRWSGINEIDEEFVAVFLTQGHAAGRTPYRGIYPVLPGNAVVSTEGGLIQRAFWELPAHRQTVYAEEREYEEQLRLLFQEAVSARSRTAGPVCAELSGGLDSSSIVCMAARLRAAQSCGPDIVTFSYTHESSTDQKYYEAVEHACGFSGIHFPLKEFAFVAPHQVGKAAPGWWEPRFRGLARQMEALKSRVILTGQFGDLIMGNTVDDSGQVADYIRECQLMAAAREAFAWSQSLRVPIYSIFWRALRSNCTALAAPSVAESMCDRYGHIDSLSHTFRKRVALSRNDRDRDEGWHAAPPRRRQLFRSVSEMLAARVLQVPESLQHISYSHPFAHRPLVEFMLTIPARVVCRPGEPRRLMRRAFADLLPPMVLRRKSKSVYGLAFREALLPMAKQLLARPGEIRLVDFRFVDHVSFTQRLRRFTQGLDCNESQLRQLILLEFWLRRAGQEDDTVADEAALSWIN